MNDEYLLLSFTTWAELHLEWNKIFEASVFKAIFPTRWRILWESTAGQQAGEGAGAPKLVRAADYCRLNALHFLPSATPFPDPGSSHSTQEGKGGGKRVVTACIH